MTSGTQRFTVRLAALVGMALGGCATSADDLSVDAGSSLPRDSGHQADTGRHVDTGVLPPGDSGVHPDGGSAGAEGGAHDGSMTSPDGTVADGGTKADGAEPHSDGAMGDTAKSDTGGQDSGHDGGHDSGHDAGSSSCVAVNVPSGDPANVPSCASPVNGPCAPGSLGAFAPTTPSPGRIPGACTGAQTQSFYDACLGAQSSSQNCSAEQTGPDANCYSCIFDITASTWGPLLTASNGLVQLNSAGCVAILEPCNAPCADVIENDLECELAACGNNCPIDGTNQSNQAYANCANQIDSCDPSGCAKYANGSSCWAAITGPSHPGSVCFPPQSTSFELAFLAIAPVFCGN